MHSWRILLFPFSFLYGVILQFRNWFYDWKIFKSSPISGKSICIGNITVGGTGKSPMTAYLSTLLNEQKPVVLSRGYGRKTEGLLWANTDSTAAQIGDEPMMIWNQFEQKIPVVVSEKRLLGVKSIREKYPNSVILLDDAYQHRAVKAGLNVLLMTYDRPIFKDFPFPAGNLRENRNGMKRAGIVVVTKCPEQITEQQKQTFLKKIPLSGDQIFFSHIEYDQISPLFQTTDFRFDNVVLLTAIAQPKPLLDQLSKKFKVIPLNFPDHHHFTLNDIHLIRQKIATFTNGKTAVVTTEKDAVRLNEWENEITTLQIPIFVQKMKIKIEKENEFKNRINAYVTGANERSC